MKSLHLLALVCALTMPLRAATYSNSIENIFTTIPDGDLNGIQSSLSLSGLAQAIADVNVTLTISGGFNGDYYVYLYHNGTSSILLNRVGRSGSNSSGYSDAGFGTNSVSFRFTFDDQAGNDVHNYQTSAFALNSNLQLTGSYQPDGRAIDPLSAGSLFDSASRSSELNVFNGMDGNGTWSLFVADVSAGGEGTLVNWGLQITTIPEPASARLLVLGLTLLGIRKLLLRRRDHACFCRSGYRFLNGTPSMIGGGTAGAVGS
jgi:subtilisin-like proprotein convertase family protein